MNIEDFLKQRFSALENGDFKTIYQGYHSESPFLMQFANCDDYLAFACEQLGAIRLKSWHLQDRRALSDDRVECLLVMELDGGGESIWFYESALLINVAGQWKYHSAQKLGSDDYSGPPERICFDHFDKVQDKIRF